jgi:hypothetical protein
VLLKACACVVHLRLLPQLAEYVQTSQLLFSGVMCNRNKNNPRNSKKLVQKHPRQRNWRRICYLFMSIKTRGGQTSHRTCDAPGRQKEAIKTHRFHLSRRQRTRPICLPSFHCRVSQTLLLLARNITGCRTTKATPRPNTTRH